MEKPQYGQQEAESMVSWLRRLIAIDARSFNIFLLRLMMRDTPTICLFVLQFSRRGSVAAVAVTERIISLAWYPLSLCPSVVHFSFRSVHFQRPPPYTTIVASNPPLIVTHCVLLSSVRGSPLSVFHGCECRSTATDATCRRQRRTVSLHPPR